MTSLTRAFEVPTSGKNLYEITDRVARVVEEAGVTDGVATVFVRHTSASLVIFENADPSAARDLLAYFERLVPEDARGFTHTLEGPDDMTSHIRMVLSGPDRVIPVAAGRLCLGTWQGIYLFEHRRAPHRRQVAVNVSGVARPPSPGQRRIP